MSLRYIKPIQKCRANYSRKLDKSNILDYNQFMSIDFIATLDLWMAMPLCLLGSLLHFTYNWSKHNKQIAIFSAVNESYWEHIKMAFWPVLLLAVIEFVFGGYNYLSFISAKTIALYSIPISLITLVFAYKNFTKKNILFLDIFSFLLSVTLAQVVSSLILRQLDANLWTLVISIFFFFIIVASFISFTLRPPKETDYFKDPISKKYGLMGHRDKDR